MFRSFRLLQRRAHAGHCRSAGQTAADSRQALKQPRGVDVDLLYVIWCKAFAAIWSWCGEVFLAHCNFLLPVTLLLPGVGGCALRPAAARTSSTLVGQATSVTDWQGSMAGQGATASGTQQVQHQLVACRLRKQRQGRLTAAAAAAGVG